MKLLKAKYTQAWVTEEHKFVTRILFKSRQEEMSKIKTNVKNGLKRREEKKTQN